MRDLDVFNGLPVFYINLDSREDRKKEMEEEYPSTDLRRVSAVCDEEEAWMSCTASHVKAVKEGAKVKEDYFVVLEDDASLARKTYSDTNVQNLIRRALELGEWDVCLLTYTYADLGKDTSVENLCEVIAAQSAVGYIVRTFYAPRLAETFNIGLTLGRVSRHVWTQTCDQYWKRLQTRDRWVAFRKVFFIARPSYSDIDATFRDYREIYNY